LKTRPWAVFTADFPDDAVENDDGTDFVLLGSRNVAEAVRQVLRGLGCEVEEPRDAGDHGWDFGGEGSGRRFWCQITSLYPVFYLLFEDQPVGRGRPTPGGMIQPLNSALAQDGRFHDVLWYTRKGGPVHPPDGTGAESPMADDPSGVDDDRALRDRAWFVGFVLLALAFYGLLGAANRLGFLPAEIASILAH
jgi:hypothetical protein